MAQFVDLTGRRFGRWEVLHVGERTKSNRITWTCRCDCGTIRDVMTHNLLGNGSKSCGCYNNEAKRSRYKDISGMRFGKLVVNKEGKTKLKKENGTLCWLCKCDCGNEVWVDGSSLRRGNTKSCGCSHIEQLEKIDRTKISHKTHGGINDRLYSVWKGMRSRCYCKNVQAYHYYGERGIKVCDEWKNSYSEFKKWALENGYDEKAKHGECTLDRIDNNGNYEPSNCRFVSMKIQNTNKRERGTA